MPKSISRARPPALDQDVGRLDVAVDDPLLVGGYSASATSAPGRPPPWAASACSPDCFDSASPSTSSMTSAGSSFGPTSYTAAIAGCDNALAASRLALQATARGGVRQQVRVQRFTATARSCWRRARQTRAVPPTAISRSSR